MKAVTRFRLVLLAATFAAASLMPLIPTSGWAVRLLDFPRLPLVVAIVVFGLGCRA